MEEEICNHPERHTKEAKPLQKAKWTMESQANDVIIPWWWGVIEIRSKSIC